MPPEDSAAAAAEKEEEEEGAVAGATQQKKKKNKKKKGGGAAGDAEEEEPEAPQPQAEAAQDGDNSGDDDQEGADAPAGKKKRRPKKKKAGAAEVAAEAEPEVPADAAGGESEDDGKDGEGGAGQKKKTRRGKKKAGPKREDDETFAKWVEATLEATKNGTEKMSPQDLIKPPQAFFGYQYTGELRAAYVSPQMKMPEDIAKPDYALDPNGVSLCERQGVKEVPIVEGEELATMKVACRLGREVLDTAARFMKVGVTGDQIDRIVYQACVDRKIYPSPLNYYRFPKSVCVSANEVICHGIPDGRPIEDGDIVNLDISIFYNGYHSDLNETFFVGNCDEDSHRLVKTAYSALLAASQMIRPGTFYRDLGNSIHAEAVKNNCAVVTTYCGHGVGQLFHGPPKVPHYKKNKAVGVMKPGHVFTIEPMINLGGNGGDKTWPDDWTAVTRDGKRSAQFEHTFLVTETGCEVLTARVGTDRSCMPPYDPAMFQL
mmetsp:Transcript_68882/g.193239  ORF Transcript_68882/g.193239 Transcript_68882/m.193239 type:complete len:488 (-) Transcript_68882:78-1541(-)